MKFVGAVLLILVVITIMLEGTYNQEQLVEVTFEVVETSTAQPTIVENAMTQYSGIKSVDHMRDEQRLNVAYDKGRISMDELMHIITSLGYDPVQVVVLGASIP